MGIRGNSWENTGKRGNTRDVPRFPTFLFARMKNTH